MEGKKENATRTRCCKFEQAECCLYIIGENRSLLEGQDWMTDNNESSSQLLICKSEVISLQDRAQRVKTKDIGKTAVSTRLTESIQ